MLAGREGWLAVVPAGRGGWLAVVLAGHGGWLAVVPASCGGGVVLFWEKMSIYAKSVSFWANE